MLELFLIALAGIILGIFTGLLPALPVFTGPFVLYYFYQDLPLEHMMVFWFAVVSGSQFFGSVATITTRIPGEESSLIYINNLDQFSLKEKNMLLYDTAFGSVIAGLIAVGFIYLIVHAINFNSIPWLSSVWIQITIYTLAIVAFFFMGQSFWWTALLLLIGTLIGPRNNYALPELWYQLQHLMQGHTFYMLILGTLIIPQVLFSNNSPANTNNTYAIKKSKFFNYVLGIKSSIIGVIAGLIPGPSASVAAIAAYKFAGKDKKQQIIAAETANNSSVLTSAVPLLILGIPINQNTLIMSNLMDVKGISITEWLFEESVISGFSVIDLTLIIATLCLIIFYILSTHLINWYVALIDRVHHRMRVILVFILSALIIMDINNSDITVTSYLSILSIVTAFGFLLKKVNVSPLPFLFAAILGDKLIWSYIQFTKIYIL